MDDSNTLSDNVFFEHVMPLQINMLNVIPAESQFVHMNEHNEKVLSQVLALDGFSSELADDDTESSADIVRVEHKLNLLLDMVGILVAKESDRPEEKNVTLYSSHIDWVQSAPIDSAEFIELKVWLRADYPKAFQLYVQFENTIAVDSGYLVRATYCGLNDSVVMQLEKMIFRHHRRVIAQTRHD